MIQQLREQRKELTDIGERLEKQIELAQKILNQYIDGWEEARKYEVDPCVKHVHKIAIQELKRLRLALCSEVKEKNKP